MMRTIPLGARVDLAVKVALKRAAADDDRSVSSMVERILKEWLTARKYLPPAAPKKKAAR
jgi:hypothetical protein